MTNDYQSEDEAQLDKALRVRSKLQTARKPEIKDLYDEFPELWELLVLDLNGGGQGADPALARSLSINVSLLNKFIRQKRPIPMRDARRVADRIVSHLRSVQPSPGLPRPDFVEPSHSSVGPDIEKPFVVAGIKWTLVARSERLQEKIDEIVRLIGEIIEQTTTTNLPSDERALTDLERAQLIAVLKTALKVLEAPMVETGFLKKAGAMLKRAAAKAAEKQVENAFAFAAGYAAGQMTSLVKLF